MATKYTEVPTTQLNQGSGKILDRVFRGEHIMLTRYGRPYVLLSPPPTEPVEEPKPKSR
jgi:antitoxin (DNA-binding transcriptional repressor) of toxin-antitoxin stability system